MLRSNRFRTLIQIGWALPALLLWVSTGAQADHSAVMQSVHSSKCLDVAGGSSANGADVQQLTCDQANSQTLNFQPAGGVARVYTVRFAHSNKCLEVQGSSTSAGANIVQNACSGGTNQQFQMVGTAERNFKLVARNSGLVVGLSTVSNADGISLQQQSDVNGDHQRWRFTTADFNSRATHGYWGELIPWPHIAVSAANLPDGRILTFSGSERETWPSTEFTYSATWDPAAGNTGAFEEQTHSGHNMFCAHLAMTEEGQVFVNGGRNQTNSPWTSLFNYSDNQWTQIENMSSGGRWYPTTVALTDGDMFSAIGTATNQRNPDRWDAKEGWRTLTGIDFQAPTLSYESTHSEWRWWPLLHLAPQGKLFHSGPTPTIGWINTTGNGNYEDTGLRKDDWYHKHGTSIMYEEGKILNAGGWVSGSNIASSANAFTVDLNGPTPAISNTDPMNHARKFHNGIMLPNGEVLVIGGNTSGRKFNDSGTVYPVEFWDPNTEVWREGAAMMKPRNYHSVGLLMTDGRVLSAGSGYCSGNLYCSGASHRDGQIYWPPYLFDSSGSLASRPSIDSGPGLIENGTVFDVTTSGSVDYFSMIKMGATTHGMNTDVRYLRVDSQPVAANTHRLAANSNPNVLSPGYWMVFAVDTNGVPSVAHVVRVTNKDVQFENIALAGSASQSSTFVNGGFDFSASNAIDGDMTGTNVGGSMTHTDDDTNAWWELDLFSLYQVDSLRLWNRTDCCTERLSDFYVFVSDDPFVSTDLSATRTQPGVSEVYVSGAVDGQIDIPINRTARFVRVQLANQDFLSLAEVQVFGNAPGAGTSGIVHYDYYQGAFTSLPDFASLTPARSGTVDGFKLTPATDSDNFAFRFYGKLNIPTAGTYTFYTNSDDGSQLFINGQLVVDNDGQHGPVEANGTISLSAGSHDIMVTYFDSTGPQQLDVSYAGPGIAKQAIPASETALLPDPQGQGTLLREWWTGIGGTNISAMTGDADYPDNPDGSDFRSLFEAPVNWADDYGTRMTGFIYPPFSGLYTFWISSDDNGELWLSSDDDPANVSLIANVPSWSSSRQWDKFPEQQSAQIFLQSGQRYYIEALQKEAGGGDNLAVAWQTPFNGLEVIDGGYLSPPFTTLEILAIAAPPQEVTAPVTMNAAVAGDGVTYSWSFGDGTADTPFDPSSVVTHSYASPGRYTVRLTVRDQYGNESDTTFLQMVHAPLTSERPNSSSSIVFHMGRAEVWNVNPDNNSVSIIDANTDVAVGTIPVPLDPRSLTVAVDGRVWVASRGGAAVSVIDPTTQEVSNTLLMGRGTQPAAIVADTVQPYVYVSLESTGEIVKFDALTLAELDRTQTGSKVRGLAIDADGSTLMASVFVTPPVPGEHTNAPNVLAGGAQVLRLDTSDLSLLGVSTLQHSDRLASEHTGPGLPNYVQAPVISPDGANAWVPSKQDNILRGVQRDGFELTHDHTVRAISSRILLPSGNEQFSSRIDHDNASIASAAAFDTYGLHLFTTLEGNREVAVSDAFLGSELTRFDVGRAPQGLTLSPSGSKLYVHNFMDRSVQVFDVSALTGAGALNVTLLDTISTVASETLASDVFTGKQLFYDARDPRLALESYMACASCHNQGGQDGRTWDFTGAGEGLRNTIGLLGHGDNGLQHWSGNFDEVQDFENQIRAFSLGTGLMTESDFSATQEILGPPKAGRSADLDALASYVASLIEIPESPYRDPDGTLTTSAESGLALFESLSCNSCHAGLTMTDSTTGARHDVGTILPSSGDRLGGALDGFDTPTLLGVWDTAPYLHDGRAASLAEAITAHTGASSLTPAELAELTAYLQQVEQGEPNGACSENPDDDCDGVDDNCNGVADEEFVSSITTCGVGECAGNTGLSECAPVTIYGANTDGDLIEFDLTNQTDLGTTSLLFPSQAISEDHQTGRIYYYENTSSADEFGYYDPATGTNTVVRTYSPPLGITAKRLAQHPNGTMYLTTQNESILTIDLTTGEMELIGTVTGMETGPYNATGDMVFAPDGTLYVVNYQSLYTIDLNTLQGSPVATDLVSAPSGGIVVFTGVAYCNGQIYAADAQSATGRSSIHRIDPNTGAIEELWLSNTFVNDLSSCNATGAAPGATDSCDPLQGATLEVCDGLDNDCDGQTDEDGVCNECTVNADCDDGSFCNGAETCNAGSCEAGTPVSCDDGIACTTDTCDEGADRCDFAPVDSVCDDGNFCNGLESCDAGSGCSTGSDPCPGGTCDEGTDTCDFGCLTDSECDDGSFCNGSETCNAGTCVAGTAVSCDDGVACTTDSCNEGTDSCDNEPVNSACDDGNFCNGVETCDAVADCQPGSDPCAGGQCDEVTDTCPTGCLSNAECDDGVFCNGAETCFEGSCLPGGSPCVGQTCVESTDTCEGITPAPRIESGVVTVGGSHVTVPLIHTYADPVVVATLQYANNSNPVVTRVSNVSGSSFDVRIQSPSNVAVASETVHYIVVEAGNWEFDGIRVEAQKYNSTTTSDASSWVAETQSYLQSYTAPVVIGQVMSENDPSWSSFWSQGNARQNPPSSSDLAVGKMTGEESAAGHGDETVGFIVFEAGHGTIGGIEFEAGDSSDSIAGIGNNPPYAVNFDLGFGAAPSVALVSLAAMDGVNGGWAVLHGAAPLSSTGFATAIDEDQVADTERSHTTEQVHYVVFASSFSYEELPECNIDTDCDDGQFCNGVESCSGASCDAGTDPCGGFACDELTDSCAGPAPAQLESVLVGANGTSSAVTLTNSYEQPVVTCTVQYVNNTTPVVPRVSNAAGNSFDLRLQSPSGAAVANDDVHCLVVEAGLHQIGDLTIEAIQFNSTVTAENNSWTGQALSYTGSFSDPIVLGQVMTENDSNWSAFNTWGSARSNPPVAGTILVAKSVAEDTNVNRADEMLGVILIEAGTGAFNGVEFEAALGADSVAGVTNAPPYTYTLGGTLSTAPAIAIATMAGIDGGNGGWAQLHGAAALSANQLGFSIDEDTIGDSERAHTNEQVAYITFGATFSYP